MLKSTIYKMAQLTVIESANLDSVVKLEILRELMDKENLALFVEKQEAKEKGDG